MRTATRADTAAQRGLSRLADPRVWGPVIGAVGASVFVHANRGRLPDVASTGASALWTGALAVFVWAVFVTPRHFPPPRPLPRSAGVVYLASVVGMIAVIQAGGRALEAIDHPDVVPAVIVLAVGLHFLPFARAFRTPMFTRLGIVMTALGATGLALGLAWTSTAAAVVAVTTGLVMLVVMADDALRQRPDSQQT
jgi:hypothetical protein